MDKSEGEPAAKNDLPCDEARQLLSMTIARLQKSRWQLETQPFFETGNDDAIVYIATAEMNLKAALVRLQDETRGKLPPF